MVVIIAKEYLNVKCRNVSHWYKKKDMEKYGQDVN